MDVIELLQICKKHNVYINLSYADSLKAYVIRTIKGDTVIARAISDSELDSIRYPSDCIHESIETMIESLEVKIDER